MVTKYLSEAGVKRLWAAIEAKFIDNEEIESLLTEALPDEEMEALTDAEIDEITGYAEPVVDEKAPTTDPQE